MRRLLYSLSLGAWLLLSSATLSQAAVKLIVVLGTPVFSGTQVVLPMTLYPFGQDTRAVTLTRSRTVIVPSTFVADLKALIIARATAEYGVTLTEEEILIKGSLD